MVATAIPSFAEERKLVEAFCPVDGHKFPVIEIVTTNRWGGFDRDFHNHAWKTRPLEFIVWVCPKCGFAGRKKDFEAGVPPEARQKLLEGLKPAVALKPSMQQADIPGWAKHDLLAQVKTILRASTFEIGMAWLYAAWCWRDEGAVVLDGLDEWERLWTSYGLRKEPIELAPKGRLEYHLEIVRRIENDAAAGRHKGRDLLAARYLAAYLWRLHGENAEALRLLDEVARMNDKFSVVDQAAGKMRGSIDAERRFQRLAVAKLEDVSGSLDEKERGERAYIVAETHRRLGDRKKAAEWYAEAIKISPDERLKKLAAEQRALAER